jgi:hypothetical protein
MYGIIFMRLKTAKQKLHDTKNIISSLSSFFVEDWCRKCLKDQCKDFSIVYKNLKQLESFVDSLIKDKAKDSK